MEDFTRNPCRHHLFEIFNLDKSETDLRAIRTAVQEVQGRLRYSRIVARDGTVLTLSEADLNTLSKVLLTPLERLKTEQLVHQAHAFSQDRELALCMESLAVEEEDPLPGLIAEVQGQALRTLVRTALPLPSPFLADDLPWPPEPEGYELRRESIKEAIQRET
jgi:hypothetical protein